MLEWRKSYEDAAPNGYVDMTEAKVVDIGAGEDGLLVDGKTHCFLVIDSAGAEHIFCAETTRALGAWLPELARYVRADPRTVLGGDDDVALHIDTNGGDAPERATEALSATAAAANGNGHGVDGDMQASSQVSPASAASPARSDGVATTTAAGAAPPASVAATAVGETWPSSTGGTASHDRLILRVCIGSLRRLNAEVFPPNGSSRRIYFELRTGPFSRTTKTLPVSNHQHMAAGENSWNETMCLASCVRVCAPLVLSAFEDRSRGTLKSLTIPAKAPPRLLGSAVISWSHYAYEECVSFHVVLRGAPEQALCEVRITLQILSPNPPADEPTDRMERSQHQQSHHRGSPSPSSSPPVAPSAGSPSSRRILVDNNIKRRASEISLTTLSMNGRGGYNNNPRRLHSLDSGVDVSEQGYGYESDGSNGAGRGGVRGALQALFAPCFGTRESGTRYSLIGKG